MKNNLKLIFVVWLFYCPMLTVALTVFE